MTNDNYGFRDDDERKAFYIALPVIALFGGLLYYFVFGSQSVSIPLKSPAQVATMEVADTDGDGIADHIDQCPAQPGSLDKLGCENKPKSKTDSIKSKTTRPNSQGISTQQAGDVELIAESDAQTMGEVELIDEQDLQNPDSQQDEKRDKVALSETEDKLTTEPKTNTDMNLQSDSNMQVVAESDTETKTESRVTVDAEASDSEAEPVIGDVELIDEPDSDADNTQDTEQQTTNSSIALTPATPVTQTEEQLVQDAGFNIQFQQGNATLTGRSAEILLEVAKVMQRYPDIQLEAHGFSDNAGESTTNQRLSAQRAEACIDIIVEAGIDRDRLTAIGFGELNPIASNDTPEGRQKNRRVEFKLIR